jgi:predicted nucleic acid-binding protein
LVTLDTSALLALFDRREQHHSAVLDSARREGGPFMIPAGILAEISYHIERRLGQQSLIIFLQDIIDGQYAIYCGEGDFRRIRELVSRYHDLPLGFADAAVIACAERHGGKVLTLDHRHFEVVANEGTIQVLP